MPWHVIMWEIDGRMYYKRVPYILYYSPGYCTFMHKPEMH